MRTLQTIPTRLFLLLSTALLSACGGGGTAAPSAVPEPRTLTTLEASPGIGITAPIVPVTSGPTLTSPSPAPAPAPVTTAPATVYPAPAPNPPIATSPSLTTPPVAPAPSTPLVVGGGNVVTDISFQSTGTTVQTNVPVTFGQVFAPGHVIPSQTVTGILANGSTIPLQVDIKARHADGSARHAIISASLPSLPVGATLTLALATKSADAAPAPTSPAALLDAGFSAAVNVDVDGQRYTASADALLRSGKYKAWLSGPLTNEWLASTPLTTASGVAHPHLSARFAIRAVSGTARASVDFTIENNWAYEAAPQNFVYDAQLTVGGKSVYSRTALTHFNHARWRKVFWWGAAPQVHIRHNAGYLIASKAVPNYDRSVVIPEATLAAMKTNWTGAKTEPMGVGVANPYMPSTGGREDIGLLPGWAATYLLSQDKRAKDVMLGTADLAGSWSAHYRNKDTDRPVSLLEFPYMTILGNTGDTYNPVTKKREAFPLCATATACTKVNTHDSSHQPGFAYLPYLVTGDYYYLEELQFWAMWNTFSDNPGYRDNIKGLLKPDQVRGQAWSLRTLSQAAYITPDSDPLKPKLNYLMSTNLDWYNANYTNAANANKLGVLAHGYAIVYTNQTGLAPWMDDFFTSAVGHAVELGFDEAKPLLMWKAKFPVSRMTGDGACWVDGAIYALTVRDSATGAIYPTIADAYRASHDAQFNTFGCASQVMATALKLKVGEMTGYSATTIGYPSNMQPALAFAATLGAPGAAAAWAVFMGRTVKPNYSAGPQFAIVPR